jgi:outer membrane protein TolC
MAIQPIYAGSRIRNGNKLATLGEEFSQHNIDLTSEEVVLKTENYYWTLVSLKQKMKALTSYENLLNNLLKDVRVSYDAGLMQKSDVLKVQLETNKISANKLQLENGISLLNMTLAQHIGIVYSDTFHVANCSFDIANPQFLYRDPEGALESRTEYQMLNKAIKAEELKKKLARGEYMPQVAIGVQGLYMDVLDNTTTNALAFATLSIPISDWWGGSHKLKEHELKINIAQNNLEEKSELLKLQMDKTYKDLIESYKQINIAELSQEQAREHLKVIQDNYDAGIISTSDLLEAQAMYQQTQDEMVDAKAIFKIKQAYYLQSVSALQY